MARRRKCFRGLSFSGRKRSQSATDGLAKIDKCFKEFMSCQQEADRRFLMAGEAREEKGKNGTISVGRKIKSFLLN